MGTSLSLHILETSLIGATLSKHLHLTLPSSHSSLTIHATLLLSLISDWTHFHISHPLVTHTLLTNFRFGVPLSLSQHSLCLSTTPLHVLLLSLGLSSCSTSNTLHVLPAHVGTSHPLSLSLPPLPLTWELSLSHFLSYVAHILLSLLGCCLSAYTCSHSFSHFSKHAPPLNILRHTTPPGILPLSYCTLASWVFLHSLSVHAFSLLLHIFVFTYTLSLHTRFGTFTSHCHSLSLSLLSCISLFVTHTRISHTSHCLLFSWLH